MSTKSSYILKQTCSWRHQNNAYDAFIVSLDPNLPRFIRPFLRKWLVALTHFIPLFSSASIPSVWWFQGLWKKANCMKYINSLNTKVAIVETSQLICSANQLTGFYIMATLAFNELMLNWYIGNVKPRLGPNSRHSTALFYWPLSLIIIP